MSRRLPPAILATVMILTAISLSACDSTTTADAVKLSQSEPLPVATPPPGVTPGTRSWQTDALLFAGDGTWSTEVTALKQILTSKGLTYTAVSSATLTSMTLDQIATYGMIIWPGGTGSTEADSLTTAAKIRVRQAVQERGVSWLGFCAGSFIAVAPAPAADAAPSYGLGIVAGPYLEYYYREAYYEQNGGTDIEMTMETFADGKQRDLVWYGGPVTPNVAGGVVARYPDGNPAISEMWSGKGFVVLSAVHPTAPQSLRTSFGLNDVDGLDLDVAGDLIDAALNQRPLPAFN